MVAWISKTFLLILSILLFLNLYIIFIAIVGCLKRFDLLLIKKLLNLRRLELLLLLLLLWLLLFCHLFY